MLSGGRLPLGGGTSMQKKYGIVDSADLVYMDHTNFKSREYRYGDRDLVRVWADENAPTFELLVFSPRIPSTSWQAGSRIHFRL